MISKSTIEFLLRKSINKLKEYPNFPTNGLIAGGSISNLMWEYVSGNKAVINDIDVFIFKGVVNRNESDISNYIVIDDKTSYKLSYKSTKNKYDEYSGIRTIPKTKDFYYIEDSKNIDIYNYIYYKSNRVDYNIIIESFDINCTQIGYIIEEDKFIYTDDFINFLNNGNLLLTNVMTPAHSAMRIIKKKYELNAYLDENEIKLCQYTLHYNVYGINKRFFTTKYYLLYEKYKDDLDKYFSIETTTRSTYGWIDNWKDGNISDLFYNLIPNIDIVDNELFPKIQPTSTEKLMFYYRKVKNKIVWNKLSEIYNRIDYIDIDYTDNDIELLQKTIETIPLSINNLKDLKLSEQLKIVKKLFDYFKDNLETAFSILEDKPISTNFDDDDLLLLEISVRKNDSNNLNKVSLFKNYNKSSENLQNTLVKRTEDQNSIFNI